MTSAMNASGVVELAAVDRARSLSNGSCIFSWECHPCAVTKGTDSLTHHVTTNQLDNGIYGIIWFCWENLSWKPWSLPPFSHQFGEIVLLRTCQETLDLLPQPASLWAPGVVCLLLMQIIMVIIMISWLVLSSCLCLLLLVYQHIIITINMMMKISLKLTIMFVLHSSLIMKKCIETFVTSGVTAEDHYMLAIHLDQETKEHHVASSNLPTTRVTTRGVKNI